MLILLPLAFISGILTALTPCVLPVLPVVLASGVDGNKRRVNGIILGLLIGFSVAILLLSGLVTALDISADSLRVGAAVVLFLLGLLMIFPFWEKIQFLIESRFNKPVETNKDGFSGGILTGISLGVVWTPCIGPIIATVATLAAVNEFSFFTVLLVFFYAAGIGLPLWLIARQGQRFTSRLSFFKTNPKLVRQIFGVVIILTAYLIYSGAERRFQSWALDNLPDKWANIPSLFEERFGAMDEVKDLKDKMTEKGAKKDDSGGVLDNIFSDNGFVPLTNDWAGAKIEKGELLQGCLSGQDCIPSIDEPVFESVTEAEKWLNPDDVVFGVNHKGIQKAYAQRILNWHEIVNDFFADDPVAVTFCPLCGTAISFIRVYKGEVVEFGVSGKLHNSDLVMYDRLEGNMWQQATGEAIVGPAARANEYLTWVSTTTTTWSQWKEKYPETLVLSRETGALRDYDAYPYGTYEQDGSIYFSVGNEDDRLHPKEVVYGILVDGKPKAYTQRALQAAGTISEVVNGVNISVSIQDSGEVTFTRQDSSEEIVPLRGFWFAWAAFNPSTDLYDL
jgi:cytochrome c biogenesis protein CcdA